mmetsp:Transcript_5056/g.8132  ORF Transcript_5056/g.8132 Transcript_5056/m.8132 type:complete len:244 (-) Transcript_5056:95-826(-)
MLYSVRAHLKEFTGLGDSELDIRLARHGRFHFEGEHLFWNPRSASELAWFYATSATYLFANAVHAANPQVLGLLNVSHGPVLDFSGGVGNSVIYLAQKGIDVEYSGLGMAEMAFARFRVHKMGLKDNVKWHRPAAVTANATGLNMLSCLDTDNEERFGVILALDVLEHIPKFHTVVQMMVRSLRVGGWIIENSPFGDDKGDPFGVHVPEGEVTMVQAMGPTMKKIQLHPYGTIWAKTEVHPRR